MDVQKVVPPYPADDFLLADLNHSDLVAPFGDWAMTKVTNGIPAARAEFTGGLRLVVLLRITVEKPTRATTRLNVPFLVDTGSPQTFLCKDDHEILGIEERDFVYIEDAISKPQISTGPFKDINVLGSDVLRKTSLFVDYSKMTAHLGFFDPGGGRYSRLVSCIF